MSDFEHSAAQPIADAVTWAGAATKEWFDTYVHLVEGAAKRTTTADSLARDMSKLTAAGMRDMARAATVWINLGEAMVNIDPRGSGGGAGGSKQTTKAGGTHKATKTTKAGGAKKASKKATKKTSSAAGGAAKTTKATAKAAKKRGTR